MDNKPDIAADDKRERWAMVLVDALYYDDVKAAKKWGISRQTVINYRKRLNNDETLMRLFKLKKAEFNQNWIEDIPAATRAGVEFLRRAFNNLENTSENIHAVAGALKILAEIGLTKEMFDYEFANPNNAIETNENAEMEKDAARSGTLILTD